MKESKEKGLGGKGSKESHSGFGRKEKGFGSKLGKFGKGTKMEGPAKGCK